MITLLLLTLQAYANDDFLNELEESIATETVEAQELLNSPAKVKVETVVVDTDIHDFDEEFSFDIPTDFETPAATVVDEIDLQIDEDISIDPMDDIPDTLPTLNTDLDSDTLEVISPDEIETKSTEKSSAEELEWDFETEDY
jgi:hypothetical protein